MEKRYIIEENDDFYAIADTFHPAYADNERFVNIRSFHTLALSRKNPNSAEIVAQICERCNAENTVTLEQILRASENVLRALEHLDRLLYSDDPSGEL